MTVEDRRVSVGVGISVSVAETSSLASYIITYKIAYLPYLKKKKLSCKIVIPWQLWDTEYKLPSTLGFALRLGTVIFCNPSLAMA